MDHPELAGLFGALITTVAVVLPGPSASAATPTAAGEPGRPNVVLIMTDDQGYGDMGAHGNPILRTPRLDDLARNSVELTAFYVSPVCAPTRASLLTGRYHQRTGVMGVINGFETMDAGEVTLAEVLADAGYRTALFGKWHLGEHYPWVPHAQGFHEWVGFRPGHLEDYFDPVLEHNGQPLPTRGYVTDILTDHAIRFMEDNRERPFFLYVPYNAPHTPLFVPDRFAQPYLDQGLPERTALVYGMIASIDENVGRLLDRIDALGLERNTVVIFLSDNGPIWGWSETSKARYNAGLRDQKFTVFEGGIRVPFFIRWPGRLEAGLRIDEPAAHIDVLPTLLDYCGVAQPVGVEIDGVSLRPLLEGSRAPRPERTLFGQFALETTRAPGPHPGSVARTRRFKLVRGRTPPWGQPQPPVAATLFDLLEDRGEQRDLAAEQPERVAALDQQYTAWWREVTARRGFARPAIEVGHPEENPVVLTPHHARVSGGLQLFGFRGLRGERVGSHPTGVAGDWITHWTQIEDAAEWRVNVQRSGIYEVALRLRCPASDAGSRVRVAIGETKIEGRVPEAELPVGEWKTHTLGHAPLALGEQPLTIQAVSRPGETVMDLAAIELHWLGPRPRR